jgi:hypothetical protein
VCFTKLYACHEGARACDEGINRVSGIEDVPDRVCVHEGEIEGDGSEERGQLAEHHVG